MAIEGSYHQHYHFIRQLAAAVHDRFSGAVLTEAFTLSKSDLVLLFTKNDQPLTIKVIARFHAGFLLFEDTPYHKGSNALACFENIAGQRVISVEPHAYNRSFAMSFESGGRLIFKCYDALINVVLVEEEEVSDVFRESIQNDWTFDPGEFEVTDQAVINRLDAEKVETCQFFIYRNEQGNDYRLALGPSSLHEVLRTNDALEASSVFARYEMGVLAFNQARISRIASIEGEIKKYKKQIRLSEQGIRQLMHESPFEETGHLIMANLHALKTGDKEAKLFNFYTDQDTVVKLKADLTPAENAEYYYRKAKNKRIEVEQMEQKLLSMRQKLAAQEALLEEVKLASNSKALKGFQPTRKRHEVFPFKRFVCEGFEIWVGKNAANNDLLTQKYTHKNDLWLHAKDVSGSHTVIKHKAGKAFNASVIRAAAGIAAYYSKHKGNALAPVSYTLKKFVRKPKGAEPGQVVIDREEVIMIEPGLPGA